MMPLENDELVERDFRYGMLLSELQSNQICGDEALPLHMWLSDQVDERLQQLSISRAISAGPYSPMAIFCMLEHRAGYIAQQLSFLNQFLTSDYVLANAFRADQQFVATDKSLLSPPAETWTEFRDRLARDCATLARIAEDAFANEDRLQPKKGRPAKAWRNALFVELFERLRQLQSCTRNDCVSLATDIWNLYFPDDEINDPDTASRIITREGNNQKSQGQNAS